MKRYKVGREKGPRTTKHSEKSKKYIGKGLKIVDEDNSFQYNNNSDSGDDRDAEEMPQIAGVVDERPTQVQAMELFQEKSRWKQFGSSDNDASSGGFRPVGDDDEDDRPTTVVLSKREEASMQIATTATSTLEGKKAGLHSSAALREEMLEYRKREDEMYSKMDDSISGRTAKTRVRSRLTREQIEEQERKKAEDAKKAEERKKQYDKWGKGLKQVEDQKSRVEEAMHEMSKPLARYKDDKDLDAHLRAQDREGDPMLAYIQSQSKAFSKDTKKQKMKMYMGAAPPINRFKIPPGYRWDGVDRSNGYEKDWFARLNDKKANLEDSYKWSVEDL